jgi:hypothetical protein
MSTETKPGFSRRDVLKKGAAAGAIAWSVPMITSSSVFAFGEDRCGGTVFCTEFFYVKYNRIGDTDTTEPCQSMSSGVDPSCPADIQELFCEEGDSITNGCGLVAPPTISGNTWTFTFPSGSFPVFILVKAGPNCIKATRSNGQWSHPSTCNLSVTPNGNTVTVQTSGQACGISHVSYAWCR